ncbi:MAG: response regulator [Lachnospirales bacterium]
MISVILIDDEPASLYHMNLLFQKHTTSFQILECFDNSETAVNFLKENRVDLVITDINMPVISGIDMVHIIRELNLNTEIIIVSGYSEFSYAQEALRYGVLDYVLKPINKNKVVSTMEKVEEIINSKKYELKKSLIKSLANGIDVDLRTLERVFPDKYFTAIFRINSLNRRFSKRDLEIFSRKKERLFVYGRDECEALFLFPSSIMDYDLFQNYLKNNMKKKDIGDYITSVYSNYKIEAKDFKDCFQKMYDCLTFSLVIGKDQKICVDNYKNTNEIFKSDNLDFLENLSNYSSDEFNKNFERLFNIYIQENKTQIWLENEINMLFKFLMSKSNMEFSDETIYVIEDAFYYSQDMESLRDTLADIISKYLLEDNNKIDTQEFIDKVKRYIEKNMDKKMDKSMTLKSIGNHFGVSDSYLGKLFRKYEDTTFNNFLAKKRIEKAKMLIENDKDFMIKDIAEKVGYSDQFYFSRIFSSIVGVSPSEYKKSNHGG